MEFEEELSHFDAAAERMIELGNELLDQDADSDSWEMASGLSLIHISEPTRPY